MGEIDIKSIGALIDELITIKLKLHLVKPFDEPQCEDTSPVGLIVELAGVCMQIFFALEEANRLGLDGDDVGVGKAYGKAQRLNSRRSLLIAAIDRRLGEEDIAPTEKTF